MDALAAWNDKFNAALQPGRRAPKGSGEAALFARATCDCVLARDCARELIEDLLTSEAATILQATVNKKPSKRAAPVAAS
jgi:hypothetical protein